MRIWREIKLWQTDCVNEKNNHQMTMCKGEGKEKFIILEYDKNFFYNNEKEFNF